MFDDAVFECPTLPTAALREIGCEQVATECWQRLTAAVNKRTMMKANWFKMCIVDKVLSLADRSRWREKNADFCELEKQVWCVIADMSNVNICTNCSTILNRWVTIATEWFQNRQIPLGNEEYLEVGLFSLTLECFYR